MNHLPDEASNNNVPRLPWGAPSSVTLTSVERHRALLLKAEIEQSEDMRNLPDYDHVHLVIAVWNDDRYNERENIQRAVDVAYKLQCFRDLYKIQDTVEDGLNAIRGMMTLMPGGILDVSYMPDEETFSFFIDYKACHPSRVQTDGDLRCVQAMLYYYYRAMASDIQSIRNGVITMVELEGVSTENFDMTFEERCFYELRSYYPTIYKETFLLHTPMAALLFVNLIKRFMNHKQLATLHNTKSFMEYEGRVDQLFKTPTLEIAEEKLLERIRDYLTERYRKEREFRL
ncbi:expressed unknown protein [Seminavis robusta]|uniref:CRAL-TRIO domain-containing protein n=1 Tax=Seminavis robusta TaxID=568900 RepID=A0A9N8HI10_9STRA|nr:expressed unknown protein [Seminavis robusta]|eukprot:Sro475_g150480.1 n/a (287) ;mRNA; r:50566-51426